MDTYRQQQAEKWRQVQAPTPPDEPVKPSSSLIKHQPDALLPQQEEGISIIAVDTTSLDSIKNFLRDTDGLVPRFGILFGTIGEDGYTVIVDSIYESTQDTLSGKFLRDTRLPMVIRVAKAMMLRPVGILVAKASKAITATELLYLTRISGAAAHVLLIMSTVGPDFEVKGYSTKAELFRIAKNGSLTEGTTLTGKTISGGVDGNTLFKEIAVVGRTINDVIHNGFYRLNRPNHTPVLVDAKAFIVARQAKAGIDKMYLQLADFHLLIFLVDTLGEEVGDRIILAIHQEEDELVEDLMELLLSSSNSW